MEVCLNLVNNLTIRELSSWRDTDRIKTYCIATGYGLDDRMIGVRFPARAGNFLFDTMSRSPLGPTQPPIQYLSGALSVGVKRPGREADHSLSSSDRSKNERRYTSTPQYVFMAWCLFKHRDNFTFAFTFRLYTVFACCFLNIRKNESAWLHTKVNVNVSKSWDNWDFHNDEDSSRGLLNYDTM
jgi:hypothetical protein